MINILERKKEKVLSDFLPYLRHVSKDIFETEDGSLCCMFELEGISLETKTSQEINFLQTRLALAFQSLNMTGLSFFVNLVRSKASLIPKYEYQSQLVNYVATCYKKECDNSMCNRIFLTISLNQTIGLNKIFNGDIFQRTLRKVNSSTFATLHEKVTSLFALLKDYKPRILRIVKRNEMYFSQAMEAVSLVLFGKEVFAPLTKTKLATSIAMFYPIFGNGIVEIRGEGIKKRYSAILSLKEVPASTNPLILKDLLKSSFEWSSITSFRLIKNNTSLEKIRVLESQLKATDQDGILFQDQLEEAREGIQDGKFVFGEFHNCVQVFSDDFDDLEKKQSEAMHLLVSSGAIYIAEDLALVSAWLSLAPTNLKYRVRSRMVSHRNFSDFVSMETPPKGQEKSEWGKPICVFQTSAKTLFNFSFHVEGLGNTFVCGISGSGKTVLQTFLMGMLEAFNVKRVVFDKDQGQEIFLRACGGEYTKLKPGTPIGFAPLQGLENTSEDIKFFTDLLAVILEVKTKEGREKIENASINLLRNTPKLRNFPSLKKYLPIGLTENLDKWAGEGLNSWIFDPLQEKEFFKNDLTAFDLTSILDNKEHRTPILMYIFYHVSKLFDGQRVVIAIDEFWKVLQDEAFSKLVHDKLKTIRKQNGFLFLATQSPSDVLQSSSSRTIVEQCNTQIFFGNPRANREEYQDGFKLNDKEFSFVQGGMLPRQFLLKQGETSVVLELNFSNFSEVLPLMSGTSAGVKKLDKLQEEYGEHPEQWLPHFSKKICYA